MSMKTEEEMRDSEVPTFSDPGELVDYIRSLVDREHDYGTCVYAMSMAAVAAFNHVASRLGVVERGDLDVVRRVGDGDAAADFVRRTRGIEGPFAIIKAQDVLYPKYLGRVLELEAKWRPWVRDQARKMLAERGDAAPSVVEHWKRLAAEERQS